MNSTDPLATTGCPPPEALRRLGDQTGDFVPSFAAHVETCERCRSYLDRLAREGPWTEPAVPTPPPTTADRAPTIAGLTDFVPIGQGGFGLVFRARREGLNAWVAVKFLPDLAGSGEGRERAVREAALAAKVRHPNIVRTYDVGLAEGVPYLIMEYVEGGTLADRLTGGARLDADLALRIALALTEAVGAIHRARLLHLDLKPSNILLHGAPGDALAECTPLVADFGVALETSPADGAESRTGRGTPGYMAPEQRDASLGPVGPPADVYALGAVLFRLVAGKSHRPGNGGEGIPRDLSAIIARALQRRPDDRFASADALAQALREARDRRNPGPRRRSAVGLTAAMIAAIIGGGLAMVVDGEPVSAPSSLTTEDEAQTRSRIELASRVLLSFGKQIEAMTPDEAHGAIVTASADLDASRRLIRRRPDDVASAFQHAKLALGLSLLYERAGRIDLALDLAREASDVGEAAARRNPEDPTTTILALDCLFQQVRCLRLLELYIEGNPVVERAISLLQSTPHGLQSPERLPELRRQIAMNHLAVASDDAAAPVLAQARLEIQKAVQQAPDSPAVWLSAAEIETAAGDFEAAVAARRRVVSLAPEDENLAALARTFVQAAQGAETQAVGFAALDEADALITGRLELRVEPQENLRGRLSLASWRDIASEAEKERRRLPFRFDFGAKLATIAAADPGADAGWLAGVQDVLIAEHAETRSATPPQPGWSVERTAVESFEEGSAAIERGEPTTGRILLAKGLVHAAWHHVRSGEIERALELCQRARDGLVSVRTAADASTTLKELWLEILVEAWAVNAKALWQDEGRPGLDQALQQTLTAAQALLNQNPESRQNRLALDRSLRRLARREWDLGNADASRLTHERRLTLWTAGSSEWMKVEADLKKLDVEQKRREDEDSAPLGR